MAESFDRRTDEHLERALRTLGTELAYPPTPDLAAAVGRRLAAGRDVPGQSPWAWFSRPVPRRLALALALLLAIAAATLAVSPRAREAVAGRLGIPGITIVYVSPSPTVPPTATASAAPAATPALPTPTPIPPATPASAGERLGLGQRATLDEARARVPFPVLVPTLPALGAPDEVYVGEPPVGGQVALVWLARPELPQAAETGVGLLITQFRGDLDPGFIKKLVGGRTTVQFLSVGDAPGYWIQGDPHEFFYTNSRGTFVERTRLAGNVLLWARGGVTYRIEGARTLDEALRIAATMR